MPAGADHEPVVVVAVSAGAVEAHPARAPTNSASSRSGSFRKLVIDTLRIEAAESADSPAPGLVSTRGHKRPGLLRIGTGISVGFLRWP